MDFWASWIVVAGRMIIYDGLGLSCRVCCNGLVTQKSIFVVIVCSIFCLFKTFPCRLLPASSSPVFHNWTFWSHEETGIAQKKLFLVLYLFSQQRRVYILKEKTIPYWPDSQFSFEQKLTLGIGQHQSLNFNMKTEKSYWQVWHQLDSIDDHGLHYKKTCVRWNVIFDFGKPKWCFNVDENPNEEININCETS